MKILGIYDQSGPKYHRVMLPLSGLTYEYSIDCKIVSSIIESDLEGLDILFYNRTISTPAGIIFKLKQKYGFKIVCDLDDHWILDKGHPLYEGYQEHNASKKIEDNIRMADAVTVTHSRLAEEVVSLNRNVHVLPNAIPKHVQFMVAKVPDDKVRLFWAGGITHKRDLELLRRPLKLIKRDGIKFVMGGYDKSQPDWKEMAKIFTCDSKYNTQVIESLPVDKYYHVYSLCDISLIPLVDVSFNRYKSNLKILEAANIGSPVVVSRVHPYLDFPEEIVNYVDAHNTWFMQINKLVKDKELRIWQGERLKEFCDIHYNFDRINLERKQIFESL
jgi:glycosyltransferase involved in cell wall biosynthesis